jgi:hypothetical protein
MASVTHIQWLVNENISEFLKEIDSELSFCGSESEYEGCSKSSAFSIFYWHSTQCALLSVSVPLLRAAERIIIKYLCANVKYRELIIAIIRNTSKKRKNIHYESNSVHYASLIVSLCTSLYRDSANNSFIAGLDSHMTMYNL